MSYSWYVGVDLAQSFDFTAIAALEEPVWIGNEPSSAEDSLMYPADRRGWVLPSSLLPVQGEHFRRSTRAGDRPGKPPLFLRGLERLRHRPYGAVVDRVAAVVRSLPCEPRRVALVLDRTGVGRPVYDRMLEVGLKPVGVTLHAGDNVGGHIGAGLSTPKRDVVVSAQAALQDQRLRIAAGLDLAEVLVQELQSYRVKLSPSGHDSYSAPSGGHDDLVMALSLAVWYRDWYCRNHDFAIGRKHRRERSTA